MDATARRQLWDWLFQQDPLSVVLLLAFTATAAGVAFAIWKWGPPIVKGAAARWDATTQASEETRKQRDRELAADKADKRRLTTTFQGAITEVVDGHKEGMAEIADAVRSNGDKLDVLSGRVERVERHVEDVPATRQAVADLADLVQRRRAEAGD